MRAATAKARQGLEGTVSAHDMMGRLRRIALDAQGLTSPAPFGKGKAATLRAIQHLGYVQIDTISVVERAHHHLLHARVPEYRTEHLDALLRSAKIFEYWSHAAAFLPIEDYRFALPRMKRFKSGDERWVRSRNRVLIDDVLARIRAEGPLLSRDFEDPRATKTGWWDWKPAKGALEQLFMEGELMVIARDGFQKTYDLTERVLPSHVDTRMPTEHEFADHLVSTTLRGHGCAQQPTFTHLRRGAELRRAVQESLERSTESGEVLKLKSGDGQVWFVLKNLWEKRLPAARRKAVSLLSPFDNLVIHRERGQRLFNFDYTIECYVPEPKRQYGYFCLPILHGEHLIGRVDAKAHRKQRRLELKHLHLDVPLDDQLLDALKAGLQPFAAFNGCDTILLTRCSPSKIRGPIQYALKNLNS